MKVVFLSNVKGIARQGEVKNVADGYYLNFLAPKKLARAATDEMVKQAKLKMEKAVVEKDRLREEQSMVKSRLEAEPVEIRGRANGVKLYASITVDDLIKILVDKVKIRLAKNNFPSALHLKEVGEHRVEIKLGDGVKASLRVVIKADS